MPALAGSRPASGSFSSRAARGAGPRVRSYAQVTRRGRIDRVKRTGRGCLCWGRTLGKPGWRYARPGERGRAARRFPNNRGGRRPSAGGRVERWWRARPLAGCSRWPGQPCHRAIPSGCAGPNRQPGAGRAGRYGMEPIEHGKGSRAATLAGALPTGRLGPRGGHARWCAACNPAADRTPSGCRSSPACQERPCPCRENAGTSKPTCVVGRARCPWTRGMAPRRRGWPRNGSGLSPPIVSCAR